MSKISLPGENWAHLREPDEITERLRRPLRQLQQRMTLSNASMAFADMTDEERAALTVREMFDRMRAAGVSSDDLAAADSLQDQLIVTFVAEWSFEMPVDLDHTLDLPGATRDALVAECEKRLPALMGETSDEDVIDPDSPTPPGNG